MLKKTLEIFGVSKIYRVFNLKQRNCHIYLASGHPVQGCLYYFYFILFSCFYMETAKTIKKFKNQEALASGSAFRILCSL